TQPEATFGVVTVGSCDLAVREALAELATNGLHGDYLRVRAFPFGPEVESFLRTHDRMFIIEQNRDGQLRSLLTLETGVRKDQLYSVLAYGGLPLQASQVVASIVHQIRETERVVKTQ
ncbi:MAG: 2-oxoacid:acceptor oxidoreductase subunit alpha, partial [Candidatus Binatia bacterium]